MSRVIFSPTTFLADMNQRVRFLWAVSLVLLIVGVVLVGVAGASAPPAWGAGRLPVPGVVFPPRGHVSGPSAVGCGAGRRGGRRSRPRLTPLQQLPLLPFGVRPVTAG